MNLPTMNMQNCQACLIGTKKQLNQELKRLIRDYVDAYIVRHDISNNDDDDDDEQEDKYIAPEERARLLRVFELSHFVEESSYHKMIE